MRRSLHFLLDALGMASRPFTSSEDFLEILSTLPDAPILLDLRMPRIDGIQLMEELNDSDVDWTVIVMTAHGSVPVAVREMKLGAIEFLEQPFASDALEAALNRALAPVADDRKHKALQAT